MNQRQNEEQVVLLDEAGEPAGTAPKRTVHHTDTPLHLAFSCYLFDQAGRLLVTRRALTKRTWPGVWTNSCCGHPGPGEAIVDAVRRRVHQELGVEATDVRCVLPDFRYRATAADGTVENEVCPVYVAGVAGIPAPADEEVAEWRWVPWPAFAGLAREAPWVISPWAAEQATQLDGLDRGPEFADSH
ncbi:isopentenyl-diphosphate delta-isomerase [Amycolatopsis marina]|uniref:Isopentenyl-diphosphate Delta-isomerase n=1 Tax=Amycolatopsis marina TaxID=490629 RepID=A0A1I1CPJ6_9PSEU|nr:isopentenyl-diphosphate Delta-isomerase [Amycolatopsis marina]SFB63976.1 isopentenyl-diphosphate delta-isomerase [Amycolatopsis marina]